MADDKSQPEGLKTTASEEQGGGAKGVSILAVARPFAAFAILAVVLGGALAPALGGVTVGVSRAIDYAKLAGDLMTQLFAMCAVATSVGLILAIVSSRLPAWCRLTALGLGTGTLLLNLSAAALNVSTTSMAMMGIAASTLAIIAAVVARRAVFARAPAALVGLAAVAGVIRLAGTAFGFASQEIASPRFGVASRGFATAALVVSLLTSLAALGYFGRARNKLVSPVIVVSLLLALFLAREAAVGSRDDAVGWSLLVHRVVDRLAARPDAFVGPALRAFATVLGPLAACAALLSRETLPTLRAACALALIAEPSPEVPLHAVTMIAASLTLLLASTDDRGTWAMLLAKPPTPRRLEETDDA